MSGLRALIFDLDGTLIDSLADLVDAANVAGLALGYGPFSSELVREHVGQGAAQLMAGLLDLPDPQHPMVQEGVSRFLEFYRKNHARHTRPFPEVLELLERLKPLPCLVLSNKNVGMCHEILKALGLHPRFAGIYGGDSFPFKKPSPVPIQCLLELHGLGQDEVLMVGDSIFDVLAAQAAGTRACAVTYGLGNLDALQAAAPDFLIHRPLELLEIVAAF